MSVKSQGREAGRAAKDAAESRPVRLLGRVGLAAYGVVHLLIAYLAVQVASSGSKSTKTDKSGALQALVQQPGGRLLLGTIAAGLVALVVWKLHSAVWGDRRFPKPKRTLKRVADAAKAIIYGVIAVSAGKLAIGEPTTSAGERQTFTAKVLALPFGQALVALAGLGVVAVAGFLVYHGLSKRFLEDLDLAGATPGTRSAVVRLGQVGYPGLGVAYGIVGGLIFLAAVRYDPEKATGLDVALKTLVAQPYGPVLLGLVAVGLAGFGAYRLFDARFHRD